MSPDVNSAHWPASWTCASRSFLMQASKVPTGAALLAVSRQLASTLKSGTFSAAATIVANAAVRMSWNIWPSGAVPGRQAGMTNYGQAPFRAAMMAVKFPAIERTVLAALTLIQGPGLTAGANTIPARSSAAQP
ncbi:MAG: hypothetical protein QOG74_936 [Alphaproteobacteria bacterium]|nr:hypothetical protein [Alphaproteobacteria bacterium]